MEPIRKDKTAPSTVNLDDVLTIQPSAQDVANYFLTKCEPEVEDVITNLKLQKLVYYAQGFHLALFNDVLFKEPIVAWEHGPVVKDLYHIFKEYGSNGIPQPVKFNFKIFTSEQLELLDEVWDVFGQYSAWKLRNMTHSEAPWIETERGEEIDIELLKTFFKGKLN